VVRSKTNSVSLNVVTELNIVKSWYFKPTPRLCKRMPLPLSYGSPSDTQRPGDIASARDPRPWYLG